MRTDHKDYEIRYTEAQDEKILLEWVTDRENLHWFPMSTEEEIAISVRNWIGFSKYKASLTATWKGVPCGIGTLFLMPYRKVAHHCMFYVIVDKNLRRQGVGTSLVKNLLHLARNYFHLESVDVEVFQGCPLLPILETFHFVPFATQEHFVKEDGTYKSRILLQRIF